MILKRLREQAGQQNWFGVSVDLVILILGVFLGIQVNNWNQDRLDRKAGEDYRLRILADVEGNRRDLANRLEYFADIKEHAAATLAALDKPIGDNPQAFLTNAYQASQISPRRMRRFAYEEARSTGKLMAIGDASVREFLSNYYTGVETVEVTLQNVTPYRENIRSAMPAAAQDAVRTQCAEGLVEAADGSVLNTLPAGCVIKMDDSEAVRHAAVVRAIPTLRGDLVRLLADLDVKLTLTAFADNRAKDLRSKLTERDYQ